MGLKLTLKPKNRALGMARSASIRPKITLMSQGPIQLSHLLPNGSVKFLSMVIAGMGRALLERIRLPSQPGPHQRSMVLAAIM